MNCVLVDYQTNFASALSILVLLKLGNTLYTAIDGDIYYLAGSSCLHKRTYYSSLVRWSDIFLYLQGQLTHRDMQHTNPSGLGYFERSLARNNLSPAPSFQSTHNKCPA